MQIIHDGAIFMLALEFIRARTKCQKLTKQLSAFILSSPWMSASVKSLDEISESNATFIAQSQAQSSQQQKQQKQEQETIWIKCLDDDDTQCKPVPISIHLALLLDAIAPLVPGREGRSQETAIEFNISVQNLLQILNILTQYEQTIILYNTASDQDQDLNRELKSTSEELDGVILNIVSLQDEVFTLRKDLDVLNDIASKLESLRTRRRYPELRS